MEEDDEEEEEDDDDNDQEEEEDDDDDDEDEHQQQKQPSNSLSPQPCTSRSMVENEEQPQEQQARQKRDMVPESLSILDKQISNVRRRLMVSNSDLEKLKKVNYKLFPCCVNDRD